MADSRDISKMEQLYNEVMGNTKTFGEYFEEAELNRELKEIKLTKATEGERKAYIRGFKAGVEMCLEKINSVMGIANINFINAEMGANPDMRGDE